MKPANNLITYQFGGYANQIDYVLTIKQDRHVIVNTNFFPGAECTVQYKLVVNDPSHRGLQTKFVAGAMF